MKLLLTFLTITLFSFGASSEYNKKFTAEKCNDIYALSDNLNTKLMNLFYRYGIENDVAFVGGNFFGQKGEVLKEGAKIIGGNLKFISNIL